MENHRLPENVERALGSLKVALETAFGARFIELRLFGSFARGEEHEESDIDVLLLFRDELSWSEQNAVFPLVGEVNIAEGVSVSPLQLSRERFGQMLDEEIGIALDIERDGILI